jgi:hypothetical protein
VGSDKTIANVLNGKAQQGVLLDDPAVATELYTYVCSKKWAMDPKKLAQFSQNELIPDAAKKYL